MAAANKQPFGSRPGPKSPNVHSPIGTHKSGGGSTGVNAHGTPKPVGGNKKNPLK